jgi:hypothetical protein
MSGLRVCGSKFRVMVWVSGYDMSVKRVDEWLSDSSIQHHTYSSMPKVPSYILKALWELVEDKRAKDMNADKCQQWAIEISEVLVRHARPSCLRIRFDIMARWT